MSACCGGHDQIAGMDTQRGPIVKLRVLVEYSPARLAELALQRPPGWAEAIQTAALEREPDGTIRLLKATRDAISTRFQSSFPPPSFPSKIPSNLFHSPSNLT